MKTLMIILACAALLAGGCKDNSNPYGSGSGNSGGSPPPPNTFQMLSSSFSPQTMTVAKGTTVTWKNVDTNTHTSTSDSAGVWDTGNVQPNTSTTTTFNTAGTYHFHCIYHRAMGMVGTITVQ